VCMCISVCVCVFESGVRMIGQYRAREAFDVKEKISQRLNDKRRHTYIGSDLSSTA